LADRGCKCTVRPRHPEFRYPHCHEILAAFQLLVRTTLSFRGALQPGPSLLFIVEPSFNTRRPPSPWRANAFQGAILIGVVVPAHNEEKLARACLHAIAAAAAHPLLELEPVEVFVVLDCCTDNTEATAEGMGAHTLATCARNVGIARAAGANAALAAGARWLSFTDCDSLVAPDWLAAQLAEHARGADAVCGTVSVGDWGAYGERMRLHFAATYTDAAGHRHIHGANLGVSAAAYQLAGGFKPLQTGEDVALVESLEKMGVTIAWSDAPRVMTSARHEFRAPGGFGATLQRIHQESQWVLPMAA
jgi:Glycosyl transferase family 2